MGNLDGVRLIDANALINEVKRRMGWNTAQFIEIIRDMPTVKVPNGDRQHSRWKIRTYTTASGTPRNFVSCEGCGNVRHNGFANYCWYCGAEMDKEIKT